MGIGRTAALPNNGRGGSRTCDLSRVKRDDVGAPSIRNWKAAFKRYDL
jgi:hypothetical protein